MPRPRPEKLLDETERCRMRRFVHAADRARYLVTHALARLAVVMAACPCLRVIRRDGTALLAG